MTTIDPLVAELVKVSHTELGSVLCRKARTRAALLVSDQAFGTKALSPKFNERPSHLTQAIVMHSTPVQIRSGATGQWHLPAGEAALGPCAGPPELVLCPLFLTDSLAEPACLPILLGHGAVRASHLVGPTLAGFPGCTDDRLSWPEQDLSPSTILHPKPDVPSWQKEALATEAQLGLAAMQSLADRALLLVVNFLDARRLYGQAASSLPQVRHSLSEVEMRLRLAEVGLRLASRTTASAQRSVLARVRALTLSAIDLLGVLLGARSFLAQGPEADFCALQQVALTIALAFVGDDHEASTCHRKVEPPVWPALGVPSELCQRLWRDDEWGLLSPSAELLVSQRRRLARMVVESGNSNQLA